MRVTAPRIEFNHPIIEVFKRIEVRAPFKKLAVLETFISDGLNQTVHYAHLPCVDRLVGWEINPIRAAVCKRMIPDAEVKVCDAYKEVATLQPHFDIIIIDNNLVQAPQFEHFNLFPAIFKGLKDEGFVIISVCSDPGSYYVDRERQIRSALGSRVEPFVKDWDRERAKFYGFPEIGDEAYSQVQGRIMPLSDFSANDMVPVYTALALKAGFFTAYHTVMRRSKQMSYILIELNHTTPRAKLEENYKDKMERQDAERYRRNNAKGF